MSDRLSGCAILTMVAAATILLSPASVPAQTPDLVLTGGKVFTADLARPGAQAIAIRGERIIAVGSDADSARQPEHGAPGRARAPRPARALYGWLADLHDGRGRARDAARYRALAAAAAPRGR